MCMKQQYHQISIWKQRNSKTTCTGPTASTTNITGYEPRSNPWQGTNQLSYRTAHKATFHKVHRYGKPLYKFCSTWWHGCDFIIIIIIIIIGIQPLGQSGQRPELSQETGMALVRCILDKFLGVVCHCFPPLFRCSHISPPGASKSAMTWEILAAEVGTVGENVVR